MSSRKTSFIKTLFFLKFSLMVSLGYCQSYTVRGTIKDIYTGETLIGASLSVKNSQEGTATNSFGFYSLTFPSQRVMLLCSMIGYKTQEIPIFTKKDTIVNIFLEPELFELEEVVVKMPPNATLNKIGEIVIPIAGIQKKPSLLGETDLMKSLQYIPGIHNTSDGKSDLNIRGGSSDQNLILLDGIPIYNPNHVFGFVSIFNTDALKNVALYKSYFPSRYGGRLSSIIDINTKDGNKKRFTGQATLGILSLKATVEIPLIKEKTSLLFSARRSYADLFLNKMNKWFSDEENQEETNFYFYDINTKIHHTFSDKTSLYFTFYKGTDYLSNKNQNRITSTTTQKWDWGNTISSLRINNTLSSKLFLNNTISYNAYNYNTEVGNSHNYIKKENNHNPRLTYNSGIKDYSINSNLSFIPNTNHYFRSGLFFTYHNFNPKIVNSKNGIRNNQYFVKEFGGYIEDNWKITENLKIDFGLRCSIFSVKEKTFPNMEPRLSFSYLWGKSYIKLSYNKMNQYLHLLSNNSSFLQSDLWVPTTAKIAPQESVQYSIDFFRKFNNTFSLSLASYYKEMNTIIAYKDGASFSGINTNWEDKVTQGLGRAYGIEFMLEKKAGKLTGSLSYTLSKTERKFATINDNQWYPDKYDRRHMIDVSLRYQLNKKFSLFSNWTYSSGSMMTIPLMSADVAELPNVKESFPQIVQLDHRNNYRLPAYHRLDIGMNYVMKKENSNSYGEVNVSLYNAYNRLNIMQVYTDTSELEVSNKIKLKKVTLFPILPSVSYTYHF